MGRFTAGILSLLLVACAGPNLSTYGTLDGRSKSMLVPPGNEGLLGQIKGGLSSLGWMLIAATGPEAVIQKKTDDVDVTTSVRPTSSRYQLLVRYAIAEGFCMNFQTKVSYSLSIIDLENGQEIIAASGNGCEQEVASQFVELVDSSTLNDQPKSSATTRS